MRPLADLMASPLPPTWPEEPTRVTLAITDLDVGGAERALVALVLGLDRRRWRPSVACLAGEGALAAPLRVAGIEVACLGVSARRPVAAVRGLARAFREQRPALVQGFLFHANVAARLAARGAGRPPVLGGLRVAERRALRRWHLTLDRLTFPLGVGSVCVSRGVERFSVERGGLPADRLVVIPNGVAPARFDAAAPVDRRSLGIPEDAVLALYVGRLDPQKGLDRLLQAADQVVRRCPTWHLALAGDGPLRAELTALVEVGGLAGVADRVHWLGRRDDVPGLLKAADYLVLPSLWEGMPNVVLEAMAAGLPVVATAVEGTEDLVVPGETGWLVPPGRCGPLAAALVEAATAADRRRAFGRAGRARVEVGFTPDRVVAAYERLWAGVLGLGGGRC